MQKTNGCIKNFEYHQELQEVWHILTYILAKTTKPKVNNSNHVEVLAEMVVNIDMFLPLMIKILGRRWVNKMRARLVTSDVKIT